MSDKVDNGLRHLNAILPLQSRQAALGDNFVRLHRGILSSFAESGAAPGVPVMADWVDDVPGALTVLKDNDLVVLDEAGEVKGAYPFTAEERVHEVSINGRKVHAMCALDALAIGVMYGAETEIQSRCAVTDSPIHIRQRGDTILNADQVADLHVGINWQASNACCNCADSLCTEMIFLRDGEAVQEWRVPDPEKREVFSLDEALKFADRFFSPLLG